MKTMMKLRCLKNNEGSGVVAEQKKKNVMLKYKTLKH